jgi:hypothetical protein
MHIFQGFRLSRSLLSRLKHFYCLRSCQCARCSCIDGHNGSCTGLTSLVDFLSRLVFALHLRLKVFATQEGTTHDPLFGRSHAKGASAEQPVNFAYVSFSSCYYPVLVLS